MESVEQNNSKKKLIVPLIALMLCAVAVIGIGYGLNSTSTNTNNAVSGSALVVDLNDGASRTSSSLQEGKFANNATLEYVTVQENGTTTAKLAKSTSISVSDSDAPYNAVEIGKGTLTVSMLNGSSSTSANVKVTLNITSGTVPTGMKFILAAGSSNMLITAGTELDAGSGTELDAGSITLDFSSDSSKYTGSEVFKLYATADGISYADTIATGFHYTIVFSVTAGQ